MDYITPAQLVGRLGKSADYWVRKAKTGEVPHRRIGRTIGFTEDDVRAILDAAYRPARDPLRDDLAPRSRR